MIDTVVTDRRDLRVLLLEGINESALDLFAAAGFERVERLTKALDGEDLRKAVADAHVLGIRSRTKITAITASDAERMAAPAPSNRTLMWSRSRIEGSSANQPPSSLALSEWCRSRNISDVSARSPNTP